MEEINEVVVDQDCIDLPPGFRFHPTDEELISFYLKPKVLDPFFSASAIAEVDLNKVEPWDLPWKAKMGEKEWYFFCVRDRKYPTGLRTNRATDSGYWKATGKDKEIFKAKSLIGMKKTLVFYKGRAPKGLKTNWVMHEYRLHGKFSIANKNEWVICRVFHKRADGTKVSVSGLMFGSEINQIGPVGLPPLMDSSVYMKKGREEEDSIDGGSSSHVTCFSDEKRLVKDDLGSLPPYSDPLFLQDNYSLMKMLLEGEETQFLDKSCNDHDHDPSVSTELDCFWNFSEMS